MVNASTLWILFAGAAIGIFNRMLLSTT